jgi:hypothetical protein
MYKKRMKKMTKKMIKKNKLGIRKNKRKRKWKMEKSSEYKRKENICKLTRLMSGRSIKSANYIIMIHTRI